MICFFFFNDTATTEIYTLSLHDALPICELDQARQHHHPVGRQERLRRLHHQLDLHPARRESELRLRSEEHTSELQSPCNLVCRLLLEKKKRENALRLLAHRLALSISIAH